MQLKVSVLRSYVYTNFLAVLLTTQATVHSFCINSVTFVIPKVFIYLPWKLFHQHFGIITHKV